jgi:hypothetical protein
MAACDGPVQFHRVLNRIGHEDSNKDNGDGRKQGDSAANDTSMRSAGSLVEETGGKILEKDCVTRINWITSFGSITHNDKDSQSLK